MAKTYEPKIAYIGKREFSAMFRNGSEPVKDAVESAYASYRSSVGRYNETYPTSRSLNIANAHEEFLRSARQTYYRAKEEHSLETALVELKEREEQSKARQKREDAALRRKARKN